MIEPGKRYLQIAFNGSLWNALQTLGKITYHPQIMIEAGTPLIKREGIQAIRTLASAWPGKIVADIKTNDGALQEVDCVAQAGAAAATVMGTASTETINLFITRCTELGLSSMIDMLGVTDPLKVLFKLKHQPDVVILHLGRDEENSYGKVIEYKHVNKIRSKYSVLIAAAGGIDLSVARSAVFNGANIVIANIIDPKDPWSGIGSDQDLARETTEFLKAIQ